MPNLRALPTGIDVSAIAYAGIDNTSVGKRQANNLLFQLHAQPEYDEFLYYQSKDAWLYPYLQEYIGSEQVVYQGTLNWFEYGKWYSQQSVTACTASGQVLTITLGSTDQYFIVGDLVDLGVKATGSNAMNAMGRVTGNGTASGSQTITVSVISANSGSSLATVLDGENTHQISLISNSQGECYEIPKGRNFAPKQYTAKTTKIAHTYEFCDEASNTMSWFMDQETGDFYYVTTEQKMLINQHRMAVDLQLLTGQQHTFSDSGGYAGEGGKGILNYLEEGGLAYGYSTLTMTGLSNVLNYLQTYGSQAGNDTWHVIGGNGFMVSVQDAFKDYTLQAMEFPIAGKDSAAEITLNFGSYQFLNNRAIFGQYRPFSDPDLFPTNAGAVDYNNFGMILNLGEEGVSLRCRMNRKFGTTIKEHVNRRVGGLLTPSGGESTLDRSCESFTYTTECMLVMKGLNSHGYMYKS